MFLSGRLKDPTGAGTVLWLAVSPCAKSAAANSNGVFIWPLGRREPVKGPQGITGPVRAPDGVRTGPSRFLGVILMKNLYGNLEVRISEDTLVQCISRDPAGHLKDPGRYPAGHLEDPGRVPAGHLPGATGAPRSSAGARSLPAGILTGALYFTRPMFTGHLPGAAEYVTHICRRKENRMVPVRSLNPRQAAG